MAPIPAAPLEILVPPALVGSLHLDGAVDIRATGEPGAAVYRGLPDLGGSRTPRVPSCNQAINVPAYEAIAQRGEEEVVDKQEAWDDMEYRAKCGVTEAVALLDLRGRLDALEKQRVVDGQFVDNLKRRTERHIIELEKRLDNIASQTGVNERVRLTPPREEQAPLPSGVVDAINDNFDDLTQAPTCDTCGEYKTDNWGPFCQHTGIPNATHGDCRWTPEAQPEAPCPTHGDNPCDCRELLKRCRNYINGDTWPDHPLVVELDRFLGAE